ncbi:Hypothetical protein NTJ_04596 [Nesidiocoris tenuis]|uniref:Uncharacterized protein n=1 Tax=Nesidiocoris tenuis TaxID=355587 RepID=A0ABN7AK56_9HEMI|nr:Hypothetical protein NTJ_04596 [Nesidiocoris tenuis]
MRVVEEAGTGEILLLSPPSRPAPARPPRRQAPTDPLHLRSLRPASSADRRTPPAGTFHFQSVARVESSSINRAESRRPSCAVPPSFLLLDYR